MYISHNVGVHMSVRVNYFFPLSILLLLLLFQRLKWSICSLFKHVIWCLRHIHIHISLLVFESITLNWNAFHRTFFSGFFFLHYKSNLNEWNAKEKLQLLCWFSVPPFCVHISRFVVIALNILQKFSNLNGNVIPIIIIV